MHKRTLIISEGYEKLRGWNWTLTRMLAQSRMFNIKTKVFPFQSIKYARNTNWSQIQLDDVSIGLDTWDTYSPTSLYHSERFFAQNGLYNNIDLLIKIQYYPCQYWESFTKDTKIPVKPWVVMPTRDFPLEAFLWENKKFKWITTVTGKNCRFKREVWTEWCEKHDDFYSSGSYIINDTLDDYIKRLQNCKWGMILKGKTKNHDGKNRRECEFSSCGIPLAMNYEPHYSFSMKAGEQFVLLKKPEELAILRDINPEPYAQASRQLYYDHFSAYGAAKTLIKTVDEL